MTATNILHREKSILFKAVAIPHEGIKLFTRDRKGEEWQTYTFLKEKHAYAIVLSMKLMWAERMNLDGMIDSIINRSITQKYGL